MRRSSKGAGPSWAGFRGGFHNGGREAPNWTAAALGAGGLALFLACAGGNGDESALPADADVAGAAPAAGHSFPQEPSRTLTLDEIGFDYGDQDAPVQVVEFSDFGCGFCRRFHLETFPALAAEFIAAGKVRWKYVTYVSGMFPHGMQTAYAAECAGAQGFFAPMSALLYQRQSQWKALGNPAAALEGMAEEAGADLDEYRACVSEERPADRLRAGLLAGARVGVRGTPTFVIDGVPLVGAQPLPLWRDLFNALLADNAADFSGSPHPEPP